MTSNWEMMPWSIGHALLPQFRKVGGEGGGAESTNIIVLQALQGRERCEVGPKRGDSISTDVLEGSRAARLQHGRGAQHILHDQHHCPASVSLCSNASATRQGPSPVASSARMPLSLMSRLCSDESDPRWGRSMTAP
jgi:hypothetical protein